MIKSVSVLVACSLLGVVLTALPSYAELTLEQLNEGVQGAWVQNTVEEKKPEPRKEPLPRNITLLNKMSREKRNALEKLKKARAEIEKSHGPQSTSERPCDCKPMLDKCNSWEKHTANDEFAYMQCNLQKCEITERVDAKNEPGPLCYAIASSPCMNILLKSKERKAVESCWYVKKKERAELINADVFRVETEIREIELALHRASNTDSRIEAKHREPKTVPSGSGATRPTQANDSGDVKTTR